jgi:hypothetical protein
MSGKRTGTPYRISALAAGLVGKVVGEQIEPRGTTRDPMARGTCPDLHRWEWMSFVGIVSHVLGGTYNPQVVGSSPTGPTAFPLAALHFWGGTRREFLALGARFWPDW